eukprot:scaffold6562_cov342-Prasinococcus_capsulatus_cf.AAC.3
MRHRPRRHRAGGGDRRQSYFKRPAAPPPLAECDRPGPPLLTWKRTPLRFVSRGRRHPPRSWRCVRFWPHPRRRMAPIPGLARRL